MCTTYFLRRSAVYAMVHVHSRLRANYCIWLTKDDQKTLITDC